MTRKKKSSPAKTFTVRTQREVALFFGRSPETMKSWARQGMPRRAGGGYDLAEIAQWLRSEGPWKQLTRTSEDAILLAGDVDTPGLERMRLARAELYELDLRLRKRSLVPRDQNRAALARWATIIGRLGERLGKRYGRDLTTAFNEALDDCQRVVRDEFGDRGTHHE